MMLSKSDQEKFWSQVDTSGDCWLWTGGVRPPYGKFQFKMNGKWTSRGTHRISYILTYGDPGKLFICHKCDVPLCVRPDHLFAGTHAENMHDMVKKDRHWYAVISTEQVIEARTLAAQGVEMHELSSLLGVELYAVTRAVRGETWAHITDPAPVPEAIVFRKHKRPKLSLGDIADIREALKTPYHGIGRDLAAKYGVDVSAITHIKRGSYGTVDFSQLESI